MRRLPHTLLGLACSAVLCCSSAGAPPPAAASSGGVFVYYPAGACVGELELELYDRAAGAWRPHPEHPRVPTGSCNRELPDQLFNELRVRCADPAGKRAPSEWVVGAELARPPTACASAPPD